MFLLIYIRNIFKYQLSQLSVFKIFFLLVGFLQLSIAYFSIEYSNLKQRNVTVNLFYCISIFRFLYLKIP